MPERSFLVPQDGGERIKNPLGGEIVFKARAAQTSGALTVFEAVNSPGQGPPYHVHDTLDERIYMLDGKLRVRLGDQIEEAPAGTFVFIPRGTPHTWQGLGDETVRFLVVLAPAGLESFFDSTAAAGGERADDAFRRFGGEDLRVLGATTRRESPSLGEARRESVIDDAEDDHSTSTARVATTPPSCPYSSS